MEQQEFEKCMERIRLGNKDGLREIYENYVGYVYTIIYGILGNKENAEDVTSEFFIRLWNSVSTYRKGNAHRAWLSTIAKNMALDYLRKHRRELPLEDELTNVSVEQNIEQEVVGEMTVMQALETLQEEERKVVDMKILAEMTFREISDILGVPLGTVTWRYQNAIRKLRRCGYE